MKKLLTLALVFSLAFVLSNVSFAQEEAQASEETPVVLSETEVAPAGAPCPCAQPCAPRCRLFGGLAARRAACNPCFANPCNPCPPQPACNPCPPRPLLARCQQKAMCNPCFQQPACGAPCMQNACASAPACGGCGFDACDQGCGNGKLRNFFRRIFAPRPYCGFDAYYGSCGDCFGQQNFGTPVPAPVAY